VGQEQVASRLDGPRGGRVRRDPAERHFAGGGADEEQDVESAQQGGVNVSEVAGDRGLRAHQLLPRGRTAGRGGIDARIVEDLPDGGRADRVADPSELAVDAAVAPGRVLPRYPHGE
jgi:hypothetical protein